MNLPADLATRVGHGVHVRVGSARTDRRDDLGELTRGDALRRGTDDLSRGDRATDLGRRFRASRYAGRTADVRAEEEADTAVEPAIAEVDVCLRYRGAEPFIRQRPLDGAGFFVDHGAEFTRARERQRRILVVADEICCNDFLMSMPVVRR